MTQPHIIPAVCETGSLVTAIDSSWLYGRPDYTLKVIGSRKSQVDGSRGEWQIRLRVSAPGISAPIEVWQFAKHYEIATPEILERRTQAQQRNGFIPWRSRAVSVL
jgi:hypothetical protein